MLQLGAGSVWTTALLAHRLGGERVVGVEIDPDLLDAAVRRLRARDPHVAIHAGDDSAPVPLSGDGAPFGRVLVGYECEMC